MSAAVLALDGALLAIAFALTAAHFYVEPMRWKSYLGPTQTWKTLRDLFLSTSLASYILPFKLGIPIRMLLTVRVTGMPPAELAALVATDAMVTLLTWSLIALVVGGPKIFSMFPPLEAGWILPALLACAALLVALAFASRKARRAVAIIIDMTVRAPSKIGAAFAVMALDVLSYGPRHALIAVVVGLDPALWASWAALGIVATFAGIASGMPMGLVGYDAAIMLSFVALGASPAQAAMVLVLNRSLSLGSAVILGLPAAHRMGMSGGLMALWRKFREMSSGR